MFNRPSIKTCTVKSSVWITFVFDNMWNHYFHWRFKSFHTSNTYLIPACVNYLIHLCYQPYGNRNGKGHNKKLKEIVIIVYLLLQMLYTLFWYKFSFLKVIAGRVQCFGLWNSNVTHTTDVILYTEWNFLFLFLHKRQAWKFTFVFRVKSFIRLIPIPVTQQVFFPLFSQ